MLVCRQGAKGIVLFAAIWLAMGCSSVDSQPRGATQSLYDRLGGKGAITAVIDWPNTLPGPPHIDLGRSRAILQMVRALPRLLAYQCPRRVR